MEEQVWILATFMILSALGGFGAAETAETNHPCERQCKTGAEPMICRYHWLVESYLVMSRACFNCPHNATDCLRQQCVSADGFMRSIRSINRQLPGPSIRVCEGDTLEVNVTNQMMMSEGLTFHWHGLRQRHSQHMDGVSMVTQCPIPTFSSFTYRFLAEDPGTHFYHSHSGMIRGEGLFGALVVRQPPSRDPNHALYDLDLPEHEIVVNDWAHVPMEEMYARFFHSNNGSQSPDNILINGRGIYPVPEDNPKRPPNDVTPLSRFDVRSDVSYRFRVINAGALRCPIELSIDNHDFFIIASDGHPIKPISAVSLLIFSGERYDLVIRTKKDLSGLHWIRARGMDLCERKKIQQFAILNYLDRHVTSDVTEYPDEPTDYHTPQKSEGAQFNHWFVDNSTSPPDEHDHVMNMTSLEPDDVSLKREADRQVFLEFAYRMRSNVHFHDPDFYPARGKGYKTVSSVMVNNISNILPPAPLLTQLGDVNPDRFCNMQTMKKKQKDCSHEFCECVHTVEVREREVVELIVYNSNNQYGYTHPLHLHGYGYRVVAAERMKERITEKRFRQLDKQGLIQRRLSGAPIKDTLPIPNGGFLILRFYADNPGAWFMHCHVATHAEIGMALTFLVTQGEGHTLTPPPDFPRCGTWPRPHHNVTGDNDVNDNGVNDNDVNDNGVNDNDVILKSHDAQASETSSSSVSWIAFIGLACANAFVILFVCAFFIKRRNKVNKLEGGKVKEWSDRQESEGDERVVLISR